MSGGDCRRCALLAWASSIALHAMTAAAVLAGIGVWALQQAGPSEAGSTPTLTALDQLRRVLVSGCAPALVMAAALVWRPDPLSALRFLGAAALAAIPALVAGLIAAF